MYMVFLQYHLIKIIYVTEQIRLGIIHYLMMMVVVTIPVSLFGQLLRVLQILLQLQQPLRHQLQHQGEDGQ